MSFETFKPSEPGILTGTVRVIAANDSLVWVQAEQQSACGGCAQTERCGTNAVTRYLDRKAQQFQLTNDFDAKIGDRLEVGIRTETLLKVSALIYLLPLAGLGLGAIMGVRFDDGDVVTLLSGLLGLMAGFFAAKSLVTRNGLSSSVEPFFLRKLEPNNQKSGY